MSAEALSSLGAPCEENFSALCKVMGDLECEGETYVFLDNLSGAEEGIELFLSLLSRAASPALHFVVSARTAGTESDFRFYGGRFYTLSASDFAFTKADIRAYFSLCGITLIEEEVEELYRLTDGWIFAICLQMLFYSQNKRFEKGIFESLVKKAFYARLSEREKNFYISLAPFYSFSLRKARDQRRERRFCPRPSGGLRICPLQRKKRRILFSRPFGGLFLRGFRFSVGRGEKKPSFDRRLLGGTIRREDRRISP